MDPEITQDMDIDEFVRKRVKPQYRDLVAELRKLMREHAHGAREVISYGVPMFKRKRPLAVISPTKTGITLAL